MGLREPYKGTTLTVRNTGTDPTPTHLCSAHARPAQR